MPNHTFLCPPGASFSWSGFFRGARMALPIVFGYLPVGFAFGVLAAQSGVAPWQAALMSLLVFAGSGQLIAADMLIAHTSLMSIVLTTFVVNLRHLLMSAAVAPYLTSWTRPWQALFSAQMTDETFAVHIGQFPVQGPDKGEVLGLNMTAHISWILGGWLGALLGDVIGDLRPWGLDFALPAMFIALVLPHCRIPRRLAAALLAGALSIIFTLNGAADWSVIAATAISASIVLAISMYMGRNKPEGAHV